MFRNRDANRPEWTLAARRLFMAAVILLISILDHEYIGFVLEPDDLIALSYLFLSLTVAILVIFSWWNYYYLQFHILLIDLIFYIFVMEYFEPIHSGYYSITLIVMAFLIMSSAMLWGWRWAVAMAILLNVICLAMIAAMPLAEIEAMPAMLMRRQVFQLTVSFIVVWGCRFLEIVEFPPRESTIETQPKRLFQRMLAFAMSETSSSGGALCWVGHNEKSCEAASFGLLHGEDQNCARCSGDFEVALSGPAIFDRGGQRAVTLMPDGSFKPLALEGGELEFVTRHGLGEGVIVPLAGVFGRGRLIYSLPRRCGVSHLRFARAIGREVEQDFDRRDYLLIAEDRAQMDLRSAIARDLHDSVVQSLAGTRYWLQSLRRNLSDNPDLDAEIEQMSELLRQEQGEVRGLIAALRHDQHKDSEIDLVEGLELVLGSLCKRWNVSARLVSSVPLGFARQEFALEIMNLVREAVSNAVRHGQATEIDFLVQRDADQLSLTIVDNGSGFEARDSDPRSLKERVALLGGMFYRPAKDQANRIEITLPLRQS